MSLVTRCPRCKTLFRVLPAQLQARGGQVRCGRCMHVFDGFQALTAEPAGSLGEREPQPNAPANTAAQTLAAGPVATSAASVAAPSAKAPRKAGDTQDEAPGVSAKPLRERAREASGRLWRDRSPQVRGVAACALLGLLLASQMAFAFRSQLAARYPVVKSLFAQVCDVARCTVTLPQRADLVKIEASDVHMIDANRPGLIQLTATLRSYADYDLAYPALDLVLTNANEHALARRIFVPEEYLDQTRDPQAGIAPRAEITIALDLDTGDLNAAGFRLDLIAAPATTRND